MFYIAGNIIGKVLEQDTSEGFGIQLRRSGIFVDNVYIVIIKSSVGATESFGHVAPKKFPSLRGGERSEFPTRRDRLGWFLFLSLRDVASLSTS